MAESTTDNTWRISRMDTELTTGQMGENTQASGRMENNTVKDRSRRHRVSKNRATGRMEHGLAG